MRVNCKRIFSVAPFIMTIHIIFIFVFSFGSAQTDPNSHIWRLSLLITHCTMLFLELAAYLIAFYLRKNDKSVKLLKFLQSYVMLVMIMGAVAIVTIDQLVSSNITAYIMITLFVGTFLLIKPLLSSIYFLASYISFYFLISIFNADSNTLLSNRVNGLTTAVLGFVLSLILWRQNSVTIIQSQCINDQRRKLESANQKLEQMAFFDALTGLSNRRYFDQVLQKEISLNYRKGYESYLIMLDIDLFKNINDIYGHPTGDLLLVEISKLLSSNIRQYDTLSRLGGEEFLLLLPQTTFDDAVAVAEKLRRLLEEHVFYIKDYTIHITASFGVSRLSYTSDPQLIAQYANVDNALYHAKQSGRNCIKIA